jgi:uncharacterized protein YbjQ (UPF0145 family)
MRLQVVVFLALVSGCTETYVMQPTRAPAAAAESRAEPTSEASVARVRVYPKGSSPTQRMEVLGVLDFHTQADSQDKGFDDLRAHAAALGADAVVDAEFEHGEGAEPSHLSGMAVRFVTYELPPYDVVGEIDIETPEDAEDKGFDKMRARATQLGADRIVEVRFDHGAEGGSSHLRGKAVRYRTRG